MTEHCRNCHTLNEMVLDLRRAVTQLEEKALKEVTEERQALWDIYGILGFDRDGAKEAPGPGVYTPDLPKLVVDAAREHRAFNDETDREFEQIIDSKDKHIEVLSVKIDQLSKQLSDDKEPTRHVAAKNRFKKRLDEQVLMERAEEMNKARREREQEVADLHQRITHANSVISSLTKENDRLRKELIAAKTEKKIFTKVDLAEIHSRLQELATYITDISYAREQEGNDAD